MENNMVYPCIANFAPDQLARKIIAENLSIGKGAAEKPPFHSPRGIGRGEHGTKYRGPIGARDWPRACLCAAALLPPPVHGRGQALYEFTDRGFMNYEFYSRGVKAL